MGLDALVAPFSDGTLGKSNTFSGLLSSGAHTVHSGLTAWHASAYAVGHADNCIALFAASGRHENLSVDACPFAITISNLHGNSIVGTAFALLHADASSDVSDVDTCGAM